jgi:hypothetical protein
VKLRPGQGQGHSENNEGTRNGPDHNGNVCRHSLYCGPPRFDPDQGAQETAVAVLKN